MADNNDVSVKEKVVGTTADAAGKGMQAAGTGVEVAGRATQATGATVQAAGKGVEVAGKSTEVAGKGVEAAGKGMQAAGKGIDAAGQGVAQGGQALIDAGAGASSTGVGAIAGVPLIALGALGVGAGYAGQGIGKGTEAAGKGTEVAGKGMQTAGKGMQKAGKGINKAGKGIRKSGNKMVDTGKDIKKEGKQISDEGKDVKKGNSILNKKKKKGLFGNSNTDMLGMSSTGKKIAILGVSAGCLLHALIFIVIFTIFFAVVSSVAEALSPITDFFASLGHWFAGDGWCPNEIECAKLAESDFYNKVSELYEDYEADEGVKLDTEVLTAAALYNRFDDFNGVSEDSTETNKTAETDEEKKDAYKDGSDRLEKLAENMVNDGKLDYHKFKNYLVNSYIPEYYKELYEKYPEKEQTIVKNFHANAILSFSGNLSAYEALSNAKLSRFCSGVKIADKDGKEIAKFKLEDYIDNVVEKHASKFSAETQKALAITVRTYVIDITDYCDVALVQDVTLIDYAENASDTIKNNIADVANLVMYVSESTFEATFDTFTGTCSDKTCSSALYTKIPSSDTHFFEIDKSSVNVPKKDIIDGKFSEGLSTYGAEAMSKKGKKYDEILKEFFASNIEIKQILTFDSDYVGSSGIYKDMLFPLGWPSTTGGGITAGWYYPGSWGYHGAIDLGCGAFNDGHKCTEIPIISSYDGVITSIDNTSHCSNHTCCKAGSNADKSLPAVCGCGGMHVVIRVTDPTSAALGYKIKYWHFDSVADGLKRGDPVSTGQLLGYMGSTGCSTGFHLHYGVVDTAGRDVNIEEAYREYLKTHVKGKK